MYIHIERERDHYIIIILFDPVFKWYLSDLTINLSNKSYSRDNRLD